MTVEVDGQAMSVLPATVHQMNNEANNLVQDSDHHISCPSVHANTDIRKCTNENEDRTMFRCMVTAGNVSYI